VVDLATKTENPMIINIINKMSEGKEVPDSDFDIEVKDPEENKEENLPIQDPPVQ